MFSTCIAPRFLLRLFYTLLFSFIAYLLFKSIFTRVAFAFCAVFNVWRFVFIWQALSFGQRVFGSYITHTHDTARTSTHLWWPILNTNFTGSLLLVSYDKRELSCFNVFLPVRVVTQGHWLFKYVNFSCF